MGFYGLVDEISIWNRALNSDEIEALSQGQSPLSFNSIKEDTEKNKSNLIGYYDFEGDEALRIQASPRGTKREEGICLGELQGRAV